MSAATTETSRPTRRRSIGAGSGVLLVLTVVVIAALVTFVLQNTDKVSVKFLAWQLDLGLGLALLIGAAVGAVLAWLISGSIRARRALK
ncbi:hypothetical protein ASG12_05165 [Williamsia sp. Leaf354]|uniref:Lipopolysaccharide assembly protein LapA domain-containing protein n=1 Tax=Williamsia herbipolensis TaxID=1603258 RepID=A0AAU4JZW0_9NOCA|nr:MULTISPECIES: LapA family protein [Williamsia]KQS00311.1 hypothetical protein ASG12_05165 [Williamsia sp. Leaf354]MCX6468441.1 LapA family protein [Mycobacteriales bacterium]